MKTKSIARFSLLCAMALVLGYFERFIPVAPGIPGVSWVLQIRCCFMLYT